MASNQGIRDYGFLSDCSTAALVSRDGSIDWWCVPRFDSPTVFGRLLGPDAGSWSLRPTGASTTGRSYLDDTLVMRTVHTTSTGTVAVTDALALEPGARGHDVGLDSPHVLVRAVEGLAGTVAMTNELAARPEYGVTRPHLRRLDVTSFEAHGGPIRLVATGPRPGTSTRTSPAPRSPSSRASASSCDWAPSPPFPRTPRTPPATWPT